MGMPGDSAALLDLGDGFKDAVEGPCGGDVLTAIEKGVDDRLGRAVEEIRRVADLDDPFALAVG